ncbi:hypothetical protein DICSQDRAFT_92996 [Dichomitus squalens LYAD-421 SS1]|uniref:Uncharacterized protein n=1 Tax=Dichomitus squalens (strain LYAD-421) TaxID=732165 RepID=R7SL62_DICSQ|nr:uncharacterized protein DICSQDRAFT_92996 [Dichomitus squalens LYAD-421 SS1]EJF56896.1 hypothetical protein DICSQDRAFT_92996 [Dichomitus squalens LYAD-421 SS1]
MDAPAYCSPDFAMIAYAPTYNEDIHKTYEQQYPSLHYTSSGLGDPSYSSQWFDGSAGNVLAFSGAEEELYAAFLAAEVASTSAHAPSFAIPVSSPPFYGHQAPSPVFNSPLGQADDSTTVPCVPPELIYPPGHDSYATTSAVPQPPLAATSGNTRRTRRASPTAQPTSSSSACPSPVAESYPGTSPRLVASTRRNAPVSSPNASSSSAPIRTNRWACPHCPYVQHNRRSPDLKRHIETHTLGADVAMWVCCGVYALDALDQGVPVEVVRQSQIVDFGGVPMIGGCMKTFSRKDALIRHLKAQKGKCIGDAGSMYQPGNRMKDGEGLES